MKKILQGECTHEVKVTRMFDGYGVRVYTNGELNAETKVRDRIDIGPAAKDLLRWEDKLGNISDYASASRHRQKT
jgi:hypothetical protein